VLFDPFGVGIDSPVCTVGYTHGYSHSGPSAGAGISKRHTFIQQQAPTPRAKSAGALKLIGHNRKQEADPCLEQLSKLWNKIILCASYFMPVHPFRW